MNKKGNSETAEITINVSTIIKNKDSTMIRNNLYFGSYTIILDSRFRFCPQNYTLFIKKRTESMKKEKNGYNFNHSLQIEPQTSSILGEVQVGQ